MSSISWRMLSLLMSIKMQVRATQLDGAEWTRITCVDKLAFGVEVVKRKKDLHKTGFEEIFCKSMAGVAI